MGLVRAHLVKRISDLNWTIANAESLQAKHDAIIIKRELEKTLEVVLLAELGFPVLASKIGDAK